MFPPFTYALKPEEPQQVVTPRYVIMATTTMPAGTAFTSAESQRHLLAEFAMGALSVADVVERLTTTSPTLPSVVAS